MNPIYLDHAAATPILPEVLDVMVPILSEVYGNPSSLHTFGRSARHVMTQSRDGMAKLLGCQPRELLFTGGGTESDNLAVLGSAPVPARPQRNHIITTSIEHHAVLHSFKRLEKAGYRVTYLPVDTTGLISVRELEAELRPETLLISVMYGNNEVGALQPIQEIGELARSRGIRFHVDAVQALGAVPIQLEAIPVDLMSFSAHKIGGPKGIGALYCSSRTILEPTSAGGTQERKLRAGTENIAGMAGFAEALRLAASQTAVRRDKLESLRALMIRDLESRLGAGSLIVNGPAAPEQRLPHILNVSFLGCSTETLLMNLDLAGIAAASGSACTSGSLELSHVLKAMNLPPEVAGSAVRFSFGWSTTEEEVLEACRRIETIVKRLRRA